jgi:hypothetical protein
VVGAADGRLRLEHLVRAGAAGWAADFNARKPADAWLGREWRASGEGGAVLGRMPDVPGPAYYGAVYDSAFGNDLLVSLAEAALEGERLGQRGETDVLALSFSCNDAVGHGKGPHSAEVRDITVRTDLALERLLAAVDRRVGLARTVVVVTADHGVAPVPEQMKAWKMPGGRLSRTGLEKAAVAALEGAFGPGAWLEGRAGSALYLNRALVAERKLDPAEVERRLASALEASPRSGAPTRAASSSRPACRPTRGAAASCCPSTASAPGTWTSSSSPTGWPRPRGRRTARSSRTTPTSL